MRVGIFLFPEARNALDDARIIAETIDEAMLAERLGADAVFLAEHHFDGNCAYVDPPVFAAHLAAKTERINIGFAVLQTSLYHPLRLAEQLSILDQLSRGRLIVGLGRGSLFNTHEYDGYQIDPASAQERFEEIESILLRCWSGGRVSHAGKYWNFNIPKLRPLPYSRPHPQILRSVASEASLVAQAQQGRPVIIGAVTPGATQRMIDLYRNTLEQAGYNDRQADELLGGCWIARTVILAPSDDEATESGLPYFEQMLAFRAEQSAGFGQRFAQGPSERSRQVLCGAPDSIRQNFEEIEGSGIGGVILRFRVGPMPAEFAQRALRLFMSQIAPALRDRRQAFAV